MVTVLHGDHGHCHSHCQDHCPKRNVQSSSNEGQDHYRNFHNLDNAEKKHGDKYKHNDINYEDDKHNHAENANDVKTNVQNQGCNEAQKSNVCPETKFVPKNSHDKLSGFTYFELKFGLVPFIELF